MNARRLNSLAACVAILAASLAAQAMVPRRALSRAPTQEQLERMIPETFGNWTAVPGVRIVEPPGSDTLSKQVYNAELSRGYRDQNGHFVMFLVAYGASQSDRLQLHRPEICYAAQGFRVSAPENGVFGGVPDLPSFPIRRLVAQREDRQEPITYWMRLGGRVATGPVARQILKVEYGLRGQIVDGALVRVSTVGLPASQAYELESAFMRDLLRSVDGETEQFLIGRDTVAAARQF